MDVNQENKKMEICYILNDRFLFYPNIHKIIYESNDDKKVLSLNTPASRCFSLLIENKGNVISREEFMKQVWNANGRFVSLNTFYQNISILRKSLRNVGFMEDAIVTSSKKGLILNKKIKIEKTVTENIDNITKLNYCSDKNKSSTKNTENENTDICKSENPEGNNITQNYVNRKNGMTYFYISLSFIIGIVFMQLLSKL